jgi:hypothetical protein
VLSIHMYEFRETVFAGRVPGLMPFFKSMFIVMDLLVWTEKRSSSINSACWLWRFELAS